MAYELERLTGFLLDLCGGEGGPGLRAAMRCPACAGPVACTINSAASTLLCVCVLSPAHFRWRSIYHSLPDWLQSD